MKDVWTVARREVKSYFDHPTAYILIVAFLALGLFLTFRTLYASGIADLRSFFDLLPWLFAVFIPAITMRSLAEERSRGTLEWLMSQPLSEVQLVVGKFLGDWIFALVALAGTVPTAIGLLLVSDASWGPMVAQYVGGALLAALLVAVGLFASSATRNQITAFILAVAISFTLILAGLRVVLMGLPPAVSGVVTRLAVIPHFDSVARGVIDLRDALYFLSTAALFLTLAYFLVVRSRLSPERGAYRRLRIGTAALAAGVVVLNLLGGEIHGRLDLTEDDLYTLSEGTRDMLEGLDDLVTVKLFVSDELPPEIQTTLRDVRDLLADYRRFSDGRVRVEILNPDEDEEAAEEARSQGIQPIQFNVLREDQFQVQRGWLGMAILYADESEAIPFIQRSDDLEYRLTSTIWSMTAERRPRVTFATGFGARSPRQLSSFRQSLSDRYDVSSSDLSGDTVPELSPDSIDVLALVGPSQPLSEGAVGAVRSYLEAGGSGLFLLDRLQINPRSPMATPMETGLEGLLEERGVRVAEGMVADYRSNQQVSAGRQGPFSLVQPYPLWPVATPARDHPITRELESLTLAWAAPLEITDSTRVTPLWQTTEFADRLSAGGPIAPNQVPQPESTENLSRRILAAAVAPSGESGTGDDGADVGVRMVVVGDANFLDRQFVQGSAQNLTFAANAVDWLAQDESLIAIRSKDRTPPPLIFDSDFQRLALRWGNLVGMPVLFVLIGLARSVQRRRESERLWQEVKG